MTAAIVAAAGLLAGGLALRPAFAVGGSALVSPFTTCNKATPCKSYKNNGTGAALQGTSTDNSYSGSGLLGTAVTGVGTAGSSAGGDGVAGVSGLTNGVEGTSHSTSSLAAGVQGTNNGTTVAVRANGNGGQLFYGNNSSGFDVFTVDDAGSTTIGGTAIITGVSGVDAVDAGTIASFTGVNAQGAKVLPDMVWGHLPSASTRPTTPPAVAPRLSFRMCRAPACSWTDSTAEAI